jgi:mxaJ protein
MCSACLSAALLALFLATAPAYARELRVCADPNNLPFSNAKGEGFENKLIELLAQELGTSVRYTWWAQRRGFIRNTLKAGLCDVIAGAPAGMQMLRTSTPYYRSSYVFVTRADAPAIVSFDDSVLRELRLGVQLIGDDGWNTPPVHALARRGLTGKLHGYTVYGDYTQPNPPARIIEAVAAGEIDVAVAWGPLAGYFAPRQPVALRITPVSPRFDGPQLPMAFDISVGVRKADQFLRRQIDDALSNRRAEVDQLLASYGVPRLDTEGPQGEADQ